MADNTSPTPTSLTTLPPELRRQIWDHVAETHDLTALLTTSRLTRQDIMSRLPGGMPTCRGFKCWQDFFGNSKVCERPVDEIRVIVEPWCSDHSWLKLVLRGHKSESVWTTRQIDGTFITNQLRNYPAQRVVVEFQPPSQPRGFRLAAFLTLRAKLYDVCVLLGRIKTQEMPKLEIVFRDPTPEVRACWRQSFWDDNFNRAYATVLGYKKVLKWWKGHGLLSRTPFYYECLLLPLILHPVWRNAAVRFDSEPQRSSTSSVGFLKGAAGQRLPGPGYKAISLINWSYCKVLMRDSRMPEQLNPCDRSYLDSCRESLPYRAAELRRVWFPGYIRLISSALHHFHDGIYDFLKVASRCEAASSSLRAAVARLARTGKGAFSPSYPSQAVELDWRCEGFTAEFAYVKGPEDPEDEDGYAAEIFVTYNRGEGRGKWRWTSACAKEAYVLWAEGKKEDNDMRWNRLGEWMYHPVPVPDDDDIPPEEEEDEEWE